MHFEILVEGQAELTALSILMPKILGEYENPHTWKIHKHRGIGRIPDDPMQTPNPRDTTLLHLLPAKLRAYSKAPRADRVIIVLLDLDDKDLEIFYQELRSLLALCDGEFEANFEFAIEELEAWYLGDRNALVAFNPDIRFGALTDYVQDSICGTWEFLARADDPSVLTQKKRSRHSLDKKKEWSKKIPPHMDVDSNNSPSFNTFLSRLRAHAI
ncbi:DUF4276 family protein [Motiliproteus sp.]|uniref:DUF4276 family protein n=1 Tax=Motiliproteus sp. TaxID=1898955 RepID=UPI003BAD142C